MRAQRLRAFLCLACSVAIAGCASLAARFQAPSGAPPPSAGTLQTDCVTAAVVGLSWNTADHARNVRYEISRDGKLLGTTSDTQFVDTTVAESHHYTYTVGATLPSGEKATSATTEINTPATSPTGDAPYCPSQQIGAMNWDWSSAITEPNGSDLWPVTWGRDGKVYTFFGDGGGFGGDNRRGRASFGIASITGPPPPTSASVRNVYGGYNALHPSAVAGKAGALIAVGSDFYTLGGVYAPTELHDDPNRVSRSPKRLQLAYSKGNAHSWKAAPWIFCSATEGRFCPNGFINYGRGNAGALDGQVYLLGFANSAASWGANAGAIPDSAATYLARVPRKHLLDLQAYRYFAGVDARGQPIWSPDQHQMQPIFVDGNRSQAGCGGRCIMAGALEEVAYNTTLKRYIGVAQGNYVSQTSFYDAPQPWGPWTTISYNNIDAATGAGGWANLGTTGGEGLGVHLVNAWTSRDGLTLWFTYSSDGKAPQNASFPPAGTMLDSFNLVSVRLIPGPATR